MTETNGWVMERLAQVEAVQRTHGEALAGIAARNADRAGSCPHLQELTRAANNRTRMTRMEEDVEQLKLAMARHGLLSGFTGGAGLGTIGLVAYIIGKIAGWW